MYNLYYHRYYMMSTEYVWVYLLIFQLIFCVFLLFTYSTGYFYAILRQFDHSALLHCGCIFAKIGVIK